MIPVTDIGTGAAIVAAGCAIVAAVSSLALWRLARRDLTTMRNELVRIESDTRHFLTARNLGPIHEKINSVAEDVAAMRAENRALNEQVRVINQYLMKNLP
jgi:hypothetical protein